MTAALSAPLSALYGAPLAVLAIALAGRVSLHRLRHRVGIGDGGDRQLARKIRVHGNPVEVAPLGILMLLLAELNGAAPAVLHAGGGALLVGRLLHAYGLARREGSSVGRFTGSALSWTAIVVLAAAAFLHAAGRP